MGARRDEDGWGHRPTRVAVRDVRGLMRTEHMRSAGTQKPAGLAPTGMWRSPPPPAPQRPEVIRYEHGLPSSNPFVQNVRRVMQRMVHRIKEVHEQVRGQANPEIRVKDGVQSRARGVVVRDGYVAPGERHGQWVVPPHTTSAVPRSEPARLAEEPVVHGATGRARDAHHSKVTTRSEPASIYMDESTERRGAVAIADFVPPSAAGAVVRGRVATRMSRDGGNVRAGDHGRVEVFSTASAPPLHGGLEHHHHDSTPEGVPHAFVFTPGQRVYASPAVAEWRDAFLRAGDGLGGGNVVLPMNPIMDGSSTAAGRHRVEDVHGPGPKMAQPVERGSGYIIEAPPLQTVGRPVAPGATGRGDGGTGTAFFAPPRVKSDAQELAFERTTYRPKFRGGGGEGIPPPVVGTHAPPPNYVEVDRDEVHETRTRGHPKGSANPWNTKLVTPRMQIVSIDNPDPDNRGGGSE